MMSKIEEAIICKECGNKYYRQMGFCCDYCQVKGEENDFPVKITKHTYWGNDSCESYQTAHYCNFEHYIQDAVEQKSDFFKRYELDNPDWEYQIETANIPFKELIDKLQGPV